MTRTGLAEYAAHKAIFGASGANNGRVATLDEPAVRVASSLPLFGIQPRLVQRLRREGGSAAVRPQKLTRAARKCARLNHFALFSIDMIESCIAFCAFDRVVNCCAC